MTISSDFPTLDADRSTETAEVGRHMRNAIAYFDAAVGR